MRTIINADRTGGVVFLVRSVWGLLAAVCLNCFPTMISAAALEPTAGDAGKGTVLIARDGKPAAVIVLARHPTRPAQLAAKEFAHYVGKITGAELPTVSDDDPLAQSAFDRVLIGESAETRKLGLANRSFAVQEYLVQTRGHTLILMGRDAEECGPITYEKTGYWPTTGDWRTVFFMPVGSVYAVHTFLEKYCGVRWYLPGAIGEVCPTQNTLTVSDVHLRTRPWTRYRWSSRQTYRDPFKFYGWRQPDERVCIPVRDMALWMFRMKIGGSPYACNHAFTHYYERFGKTHPEWWKDGKPSDQYPHPDYANPKLIRQATQDAIEYFSTGKKYPGATADGDYFAIMPNDGKKGLIWSAAGERLRNNDPDRQAGYSCGWGSELVFQMVNTAAHIVRQNHPDKWITCSAYAGYSLPPQTIPAWEPNVSIQRAGFLDSAFAPPQWKWETENLVAWSKLTPELYVWEYYLTQWFQKFKAFPVVYPRHVARSMQFLRQTGVRGMFLEASAAKLSTAAYSDGALANPAEDLLNHYVTWKLLSDPSQDVEQLLQEFYPLFFGPAAPPMKQFFTLLESRWTAPEVVASTLPPDRKYWEVMCTPQILDSLQEAIDRALALAQEEPYHTRVVLMDHAILRLMQRHFAEHRQLYSARKRIFCPMLSPPPVINAVLPDPCWKGANASGPFGSPRGLPLPVATSFRIARDAKNLHLAIACGENNAEQGPAFAHDSAASRSKRNDRLTILIDPGRTRTRCFRIAVDRQGALMERIIEPGKKDVAWRSGAAVRSAETGTGWTAIIRLPLKPLSEKDILPGEVWGLNVLRYRTTADGGSEPEIAAWSPTIESPENLDAAGILGFSPRTTAGEWPQPLIHYDFQEDFVFHGETRQQYFRVNLPVGVNLATDDFTIGFWYKASQNRGDLLLSTTTAPYWALSFTESGWKHQLPMGPTGGEPPASNAEAFLRFAINSGGGRTTAGTVFVDRSVHNDHAWHHYLLMVDRGKMVRLYLDGEPAGVMPIAEQRGPLKQFLTIGGPHDFLEGVLHEFVLYQGSYDDAFAKRLFERCP